MPFLPEPRSLAVTVDRVIVRIALATVFGLPLAAFAVMYGWWALILALGALREGYRPFFSAGLLTVTTLGILGILGGWLRLLRRQSTMSEPTRRATVTLLWCGVVAAVSLGASMFFGEMRPLGLVMATIWSAVAIIGMVLIHATPARDMERERETESVVG
jgi:hypothetical protein